MEALAFRSLTWVLWTLLSGSPALEDRCTLKLLTCMEFLGPQGIGQTRWTVTNSLTQSHHTRPVGILSNLPYIFTYPHSIPMTIHFKGYLAGFSDAQKWLRNVNLKIKDNSMDRDRKLTESKIHVCNHSTREQTLCYVPHCILMEMLWRRYYFGQVLHFTKKKTSVWRG
jgi:hypothetical protein